MTSGTELGSNVFLGGPVIAAAASRRLRRRDESQRFATAPEARSLAELKREQAHLRDQMKELSVAERHQTERVPSGI